MKFITLNQVLNIIRTICNNHLQINSFVFGSITDISASEQEQYTMVWCDINDSQMSERMFTMNLSADKRISLDNSEQCTGCPTSY